MFLFAGFVLAAFICSRLVIPVVKGILTEAGFLHFNYRKENIPLGMGLVFFLSTVLVTIFGKVLGYLNSEAYFFLFAISVMGLIGLVDDVFGTRRASGLGGHLKKLFMDREMTTGALKAVTGGLIALTVSFELDQGLGIYKWLFGIVNILTVALATNAINLLDLRPGRAGKSFLIFAAFVILLGLGKPQLLYLAIVLGSLTALLPLDLRAEAMMGDIGSNILGITIGYVAVHVLPWPTLVIFVSILIALHLVTEKYSLTKIIDNNKFLTFLDALGRRRLH